MTRRAARSELGQATLELVGGLPLLIACGLVAFQLLAVGYTAVLAGTAAEAGALALAGGADVQEAARHAVPGWSRAQMAVSVRGGDVRVLMRPLSPVRALSRQLGVRAHAAVRTP